VTDTQTGLRGIPRAFMRELLDVPGERFEFETQMLLECAGSYPVIEVPIQTIYDSKENHQTHFNTLTDSVKIYRILAKKFMKYVFASFSSCVLDLVLFTIFCSMLKGKTGSYVAAATVLARVISATCNYALNYKVVFESKQKVHTSGVRYFLLAAVQMGLSAFLVTAGCSLISTVPETAVKVVVDGVLFFISYAVQQRYVF
jgi:putative flippase GtrA